MTHLRHVLVLPDRDAAADVAAKLTDRLDLPEEPRPVREALAGDDDAEDAQWLVVLDDPEGSLDTALLAALAEEHEGWVEWDEG
ncbi:hypothetical protein [Streptomyces litchfieldiae]|uniref:Uncharacterized protein n=1 Tax=Streptomyces litchfieldiae TaxID=3075543 RepID=A0ABU2MUI3_9ACTN|nr:hypothetical protein [Streptomyces sp. DSM 44938]MDT0345303.1 hypothetical protein [Streptomyces sp. DSM 44938]